MIQTLEGVPYSMRIVRLPGIHHDANAVLLMDSEQAILIDSGTAWYQLLQQERIVGQLGEDLTLREIVLTSRRYPFSGGCASISERFENVPIKAHASAISSLATGDFFTTWANRFDSDMPIVNAMELDMHTRNQCWEAKPSNSSKHLVQAVAISWSTSHLQRRSLQVHCCREPTAQCVGMCQQGILLMEKRVLND